jgi:hypothetical protein
MFSKRRSMKDAFCGGFLVLLVLSTGYGSPQTPVKSRLPDLVVSEIRLTAPARFAGDRLIAPLAVTVINRGTAPAGAFEIAFFRQLPEAAPMEEGLTAEHPVTVATLAGGATATATVDLRVGARSEAGRIVRLRAVADGAGTVAESDERNNASDWLAVGLPMILAAAPAPKTMRPAPKFKAAVAARTFTAQERIPDLAVTASEIEVVWIPMYDRTGRDFLGMSPRALVMVRNLGNGPARNTQVSAELLDSSGSSLGRSTTFTNINNILPGAFWLCDISSFWNGSTPVSLTPPRGVVIRVTVDPANAIAERDERNNTVDKVSMAIRY